MLSQTFLKALDLFQILHSLQFLRRPHNTPLITWTVKSAEEERKAYGDGFDTVIFENYIPKEKE